ncbi:hypothetical protein CDL12_30485 [Handroanthus impetiginosus]|uniref:Uncharacterized protein n=1 Tax=Handroanthus impetiginosus TaxID=429701 RepID=A0A2G9FVG3_9LAMI|nr:hypothetical protein CDL12_30485 [Handroanthus impetiginosus]
MHGLIDFQDVHPSSVHFSFGIAEQCARHEKILKLLTSGSIEEQDSLLDLMMLYDLTGCQSLMTDFSQQPFASSSPPLQDLVYPTRELYLNEPFLDLENAYHPNGQLQYSCSGDKMNDILSVISDFHSPKHTNKSRKQTMLVPYFERWRRARGKTDVLKPPTEKVGSPKR